MSKAWLTKYAKSTSSTLIVASTPKIAMKYQKPFRFSACKVS